MNLSNWGLELRLKLCRPLLSLLRAHRYDMRFDDVKYAYFKHVAETAVKIGCSEKGPE